MMKKKRRKKSKKLRGCWSFYSVSWWGQAPLFLGLGQLGGPNSWRENGLGREETTRRELGVGKTDSCDAYAMAIDDLKIRKQNIFRAKRQLNLNKVC